MKKGYSYESAQANAATLMRAGLSRTAAWRDAYASARTCFFTRYPHGLLPHWLAYPNGQRTQQNRGSLVERNPARKILGTTQSPAVKHEIAKLAKLGFEFSGHRPKTISRVERKPVANVGLAIGECVGVMYRAKRDGETKTYLHRFVKKQARPLLIVLSDGHLVLHGGAYTFTDRGIEDKPR